MRTANQQQQNIQKIKHDRIRQHSNAAIHSRFNELEKNYKKSFADVFSSYCYPKEKEHFQACKFYAREQFQSIKRNSLGSVSLFARTALYRKDHRQIRPGIAQSYKPLKIKIHHFV